MRYWKVKALLIFFFIAQPLLLPDESKREVSQPRVVDTKVRCTGADYMKYFKNAMKTTKIDEGTYVSKFSIGDN